MRARFAAALVSLPFALAGQSPAASNPAATYLERYREVMQLAPQTSQVATVDHLVLTRDVGRLTLETGTLSLLSTVGGRTVGAAFRGIGRFTFTPTWAVEQAALRGFADTTSLDEPITEAILLFADSTTVQLRGLTFHAGDVPADLADHVHDFVTSLQGQNEGAYGHDVMGPLLNDETTGLFLARLERSRGGAVLFELDPSQIEAVQLYRPVGRIRWSGKWAVVTQFPSASAPIDTTGSWSFRHRLGVPHYAVAVTLTPTAMADLDFAASATLTLHPEEAVGPWLLFTLHPRLMVDSVRWNGRTSASYFKAKESIDLWIRADQRLAAGDSASLTVYYHGDHGDLIDRFSNWFFIDPTAEWYPVNGQGANLATFELTFHSPSLYPLATVGDRVDSSVTGKTLMTRWVTRRPTPFASFNLGLFDQYHVQVEGAPTLDVLMSEAAHRELARQAALEGGIILQQGHMRENVAADVSNSLKWYAFLFGDPPFSHYYVTEIPYGEGVSFPGLIDLAWSTFQNTSLDGFDEFFRAHEVAHQWWGNGVGVGSYRDAWLSEGLATFAALRYVQSERRHSTEYFKFLDQYRADIKGDRDDAGPIWIGYRNATPDVRSGYNVMIYEKGAWVFHMLRIMMLDLGTMNEDRFTEMMRDYYDSFRGRAASTADFQGVVERHVGMSMNWFFDEWVKGTELPTYHVAWTSEAADAGRYVVRLRVSQEHVGPAFRMPVIVSADLGGNRFAHFRITVTGSQRDYVSPPLPGRPVAVTFNDLNGVLCDVKTEGW